MATLEDAPRADALASLQDRVGHRFADPTLLLRALTHRSYANEHPDAGRDNERLEFLGDAVLDLAVAEWLFAALPDQEEGVLTAAKARLVSEGALADIARWLELGRHLRLGRGEEQTGGREKPSLLADALEAVVAAVFLDAGYARAVAVVGAWMQDRAPKPARLARQPRDARSTLQELTQERWSVAPRYVIEGSSGPDHDLRFRARVEVPGGPPAHGEGSSKKAAKRAAAKVMLDRLVKAGRRD